jgi:hypothetical protein
LGNPAAAVEFLQRATSLGCTEDWDLAEVQFMLADAMTCLGRDRAKAHKLAVEARDACRSGGHGALDARNLQRVETWLDGRPGDR